MTRCPCLRCEWGLSKWGVADWVSFLLVGGLVLLLIWVLE
jgi:hypothetical protein